MATNITVGTEVKMQEGPAVRYGVVESRTIGPDGPELTIHWQGRQKADPERSTVREDSPSIRPARS